VVGKVLVAELLHVDIHEDAALTGHGEKRLKTAHDGAGGGFRGGGLEV
jgi:hypothetical protein